MVRAFPFVALAMLLLSSCSEGERGRPLDGPPGGANYPVPYDSLLLGEYADEYVGHPFNIVVIPGEAGNAIESVWVSDQTTKTIARFDGQGRFRDRVGSPGPGPHELLGLSMVFPYGNDRIGAFDDRSGHLKWFDRDTGVFLEAVRREPGSVGLSRPLALYDDPSSLIFPLMDRARSTSVAVLNTGSGGMLRSGPLPQPYRASIEQGQGAFAAFFGLSFLDRFDRNSFVLAFSGYDGLFLVEIGEHRVSRSTLLGRVPRLHRRGIEDDLWRKFDIPAEFASGLGVDLGSFARGLGVLEDGRIALVHADFDGEGLPPTVVLRTTAYLTVLDLEEDRACVDVLLPVGAEDRPVFDFGDSVLYALDRRITADLTLETWLFEFPVPSWRDCPNQHRRHGWVSGPQPGSD
jgi:hypothetical protein